jgi:hypothetical protein
LIFDFEGGSCSPCFSSFLGLPLLYFGDVLGELINFAFFTLGINEVTSSSESLRKFILNSLG